MTASGLAMKKHQLYCQVLRSSFQENQRSCKLLRNLLTVHVFKTTRYAASFWVNQTLCKLLGQPVILQASQTTRYNASFRENLSACKLVNMQAAGIIRIHHEREGWIEKSVQRITNWQQPSDDKQ